MFRTVKSNGFAYSDIFTVFERENGTTNERDHYKSMDGKYSIDYSDCGGRIIKKYHYRYKELRNFVLVSILMQ